MRNGVQYASIVVKRVPMYDDRVAEKVIEHIAGFYPPRSLGPCDCEPLKRLAQMLVEASEQPGFDLKAFDMSTPECLLTCSARILIPFDARALVEEKCGRFKRGGHVGKLRGWADIKVCTVGGWLRHGPGERNGRVVYPGTIVGINIGDDFSGKTYLSVE